MMRKKRGGFTLFEVLIAISILAIIMGMTTVMFRGTQKSFIKARSFQQVTNIAHSILSRMHKEVQAVFIDDGGRSRMLGIDQSGTPLKTDSVADECYFIAPRLEESLGDIAEIGYWQRVDGMLMRHFECPPDFSYATVMSDDALGLVVSNFNVMYASGGGYIDSWDSSSGSAQEGTFPALVQIAFSVRDEDNIIQKDFQTLVHVAAAGR